VVRVRSQRSSQPMTSVAEDGGDGRGDDAWRVRHAGLAAAPASAFAELVGAGAEDDGR
jgi:hypothetical protein